MRLSKLLIFIIFSGCFNSYGQTESGYSFSDPSDSIQNIFNDTIIEKKIVYYKDGGKKAIVYFDRKGSRKKMICYYPNGRKRIKTRWNYNILLWRIKTISILYNEKGRMKKRVVIRDDILRPRM